MLKKLSNFATVLYKAGYTSEATRIAELVKKSNLINNLYQEWQDYWQQAQQAPRAAEKSDKLAAYENWIGTKQGLEGSDLELRLRSHIFSNARTADVSNLLKSPELRKKLKKDLEHSMKKDKGPDSLDEAYDKLDDQVEEQMDEIVPPGKPDKTG